MEALGCQCQRQHLQLTELRIFTRTRSHRFPWWLRSKKSETRQKDRGQPACFAGGTVSPALGKDFHLWQQCNARRGCPRGRLRRVSWKSSGSCLLCNHQKGSIHHPHAEDSWCLLLPFCITALLSFAFPSLHVPARPFQTFRENTQQ